MMAFAKLRLLLSQQPSALVWEQICSVFEAWTEDDFVLAINYANEYLQSWDISLRHFEAFEDTFKLPVWWPLIRSFRFETKANHLPKIFRKTTTDSYHLGWIRKLDLSECSRLKSLDSIGHLHSIEELILSGCKRLKDLEHSSLLPLKKLNLNGCLGLKKLQELPFEDLESLHMRRCSQLRDLSFLSPCKKLKEVDFQDCDYLENVELLQEMPLLKTLSLQGSFRLQRLPHFDASSSLEEVTLDRCPTLGSIIGLYNVHCLKKLSLQGCSQLRNLNGISHNASLEVIQIQDCFRLQHLRGLKDQKGIKSLDLTGCHSLKSIRHLSSLPSLERLVIRYNEGWTNILELSELTSLKKLELFLNYNTVLDRCDFLEPLQQLEELHLVCWNLRDLSGLAKIPSLQFLDLSRCYGLGVTPTKSVMRTRDEVMAFQEQVRQHTC